jgi:hypothetical protein
MGTSVVRGQRDRRVSRPLADLDRPMADLDSARLRSKFEMSKNGRLSVSIKRHRQEPLPTPNGLFFGRLYHGFWSDREIVVISWERASCDAKIVTSCACLPFRKSARLVTRYPFAAPGKGKVASAEREPGEAKASSDSTEMSKNTDRPLRTFFCGHSSHPPILLKWQSLKRVEATSGISQHRAGSPGHPTPAGQGQ